MANPIKYKTISELSEVEIIEKKSKFLASICPVSTEEEAQEFILKIRKKHYNANHNCYAYRVGLERDISRYSDDGEPSGTAGIPMLNILNGEELRNVVVVVTRYFGGTLLGTGGLVRAYTAATKEGLLSAKIIEKNLYSIVDVTVDYGLSGKIQYEAINLGHYIYHIEYSADVIFTILVEKPQAEKFLDEMTEITNATALIEVKAESFGTKYEDTITLDS